MTRRNAEIPRNPRRPLPAIYGAACLLAAALLTTTAAKAQQDSPDSAWQFEATPYLWASAMEGDVQAGPLPQIDVDMSFSDIVENLDFGLMGTFEARKDRLGIMLDGLYMNVSDSATATRTGPGPVGAPLSVNADARIKQALLSAALAWRASEGATTVDFVGGARYSRIDASASIDGSLFGQTGFVDRDGDKSWWDPYVGTRLLHRLGERWTLVGYGDIGGFGLGSEFTWHALAGLNYAFSPTVTAKFGYRYIDVDYDDDGFVYDMATHGFVAGVGIRF